MNNELDLTPQLSLSVDERTLRIEGFPATDGYYWYYRRGQVVPSLVLVGTGTDARYIKDGAMLQGYWYPGEFFVGPINPPFATPDDLASSPRGHYGEEIYPKAVAGIAVADQR
jgi:hypothetical protein